LSFNFDRVLYVDRPLEPDPSLVEKAVGHVQVVRSR
jgi:hypothetical protein